MGTDCFAHRVAMSRLALVAVALAIALAAGLPSEVSEVGETAAEALMGLDDTDDAVEGDLGESMVSTKGEGKKKKAKPQKEEAPKVYEPEKVVPTPSKRSIQRAERKAEALVTKLREVQSRAQEAVVKADDADAKVDALTRLASVKQGDENDRLKKQAFRLSIKAKVLRKKAVAASKRAYEMKLQMKEQVKAELDDDSVKMQKAKFKAVEAAEAKAEALTKAAAAKMKKPVSNDPCDKAQVKSEKLCDLEYKRQKKAGEMVRADMKKERKYCIAQAKVVHGKCKTAQVAKQGAVAAFKYAKKTVDSAKSAINADTIIARALASFKDIKAPKKPDGPMGLFQYNQLVYLANKDGTRTWVRYPTKACAKATGGVVPQQFAVSKTKKEFDEKESVIACEYAPYEGKGNPDFYKNCDCAGFSNKKKHGGHCAKWGFKFNWCYVVEACAYGNTAYSDEVKGAKVLVGCNIPEPPIPESMPDP